MTGTLARDYQFYRGPELSSPSCGWSWTRGLTLRSRTHLRPSDHGWLSGMRFSRSCDHWKMGGEDGSGLPPLFLSGPTH